MVEGCTDSWSETPMLATPATQRIRFISTAPILYLLFLLLNMDQMTVVKEGVDARARAVAGFVTSRSGRGNWQLPRSAIGAACVQHPC